MAQAFALADQVKQWLDKTDEQVALLARVGQDLSAYGLTYSHAGLIIREHPSGPWTVVHELNECNSARSGIFIQGLANFFADDLYRYDAGIYLLPRDTQARLKPLLTNTGATRLHEPAYNMLAYPFSTKYQNSNGWVIETLAAALADDPPVQNRHAAQAWLKANDYQPSRLQISMLKRLGGRATRANIAFDDHPDALRWAGKIDVVSVDSITHFLNRFYQAKGQRLLEHTLSLSPAIVQR